MNDERRRAGSWFAQEWTALLGNVMESLAGARPAMVCKEPPESTALAGACQEIAEQHGDILWWEQAFPLPGSPALWIGAPRASWSQLASRVLGAAGVEDESQARETYFEILQQSLGELARSAGSRWNQEVVCPAGKEPSAPPPAGEFYLVEAAYPEATLPTLVVAITGAPEKPPASSAEALAPSPGASSELQFPAQSKTFDLLLGVELPVSVSFGRVQVPLKDVLKFTAGSIIELNRAADEPVEVIINNCVVARGEVVVVEGNYGVRIQQIMSREQRLENLP